MRRSCRELLSKVSQVDAIALFKRGLADLMLLDVVIPTETYAPSIRGLETRAAVGVTPNMSAFDRPRETAGYTAMVFAYPGAVSGTLAAVRLTSFLALKPVR